MTSDEKIAQLAAAVDEETKARPGAPQTHPEFDRLIRTIWRLRQEDGCPWDKEQTHQSISKNMIEEAYEAVEAIAEGSPEHLEEELGDVLEQVVLHSQIEADSGASAGSGARSCSGLRHRRRMSSAQSEADTQTSARIWARSGFYVVGRGRLGRVGERQG